MNNPIIKNSIRARDFTPKNPTDSTAKRRSFNVPSTDATPTYLGGVPSDVQPVYKDPTTSKVYSPKSSVITDMQQAIIDFSNKIASTNLTPVKPTGNPYDEKQPDVFGNYLEEQYLGKKLSDMAKTIKGIGHHGNLYKPDGVWGTKTQDAIKSIILIGEALINLSNDLSIKNNSADEDVEGLKKIIPESYTVSADKKEEIAPAIKTYINNISRLFEQIKKHIMDKPDYKAIIDKKKIFLNIPRASSSNAYEILTDEEKKIFDENQLTPFPKNKITLRDLLNPQAFKDYLLRNNIAQQDARKQLDQISDEILQK